MAQDLPEKAEMAAAPSRTQALRRAVQERERELAILADISTRLHGEEDVQVILDKTLDALLGGLGLDTAWVFLQDEKVATLRLAAHRGLSSAYVAHAREQGLGECLCREVLASGQGVQARNTTQCPRLPTIAAGLEQPVAHASVPLAFEGTSRGVLNVASRPGTTFEPAEL
ncbi:MAG TPA: GAF domain-containing protein, partial [Vicinamibacteria bacterium]|nr:GAF domain-containing protein [Vicinamibacteria bacterium]